LVKKVIYKEWYYDWEDEDPHHRHQSHLFGLFPDIRLYRIRLQNWQRLAGKTLEIKGDETTGWSKGWRINLGQDYGTAIMRIKCIVNY